LSGLYFSARNFNPAQPYPRSGKPPAVCAGQSGWACTRFEPQPVHFSLRCMMAIVSVSNARNCSKDNTAL